MSTEEIRANFLVETFFDAGEIKLVYSHVDRMIIGSAVPLEEPLELETSEELAADFFAQRRELGVINIGAQGAVTVDGVTYPMACREMLYIGRGSRDIHFSSVESAFPARFYLVSLPAHDSYPTTHIELEQAHKVELGDSSRANRRTIYQYIHENGVGSCQLVMGFTSLDDGSVWNTMPAHTHERRSEAYMYFDLQGDDAAVFHLMGEPTETRHLVMREGNAVISPSWSIHAGVGTEKYSFVWAMGGENQTFDDMDLVPMSTLA